MRIEGNLLPGQQRAIFVTDDDLFGGQIQQDFRGRLQITVVNGKPIYALIIIQIQRTDGPMLSVATLVEP